MAKVFLRVYNREIESMIEGGQLDEAVAHCQHILKTFPMHVETYRLLGKAFLEARRYADAADIFQRVLMAVPDDFVTHVGISIIRDDENQMDDAIWHMERAFEIQPSNSAIQGELRRLYGRRDGVEPSKIRLSRDALANMYSQGELFNQAIAEIRSVLAEDINRPDLQVMLARAYYRSGQKVEAAEMAVALLKKYPYCMDALRVLVDVLPGTARAENTQVYRQRLHMLDPYSSFTINSVFASDQVADSDVSLERLEYRTSPTPASSQPDWASSLGIKLNDEKRAETPPEWMQSAETPEQPTAFTPEASGPVAIPATSTAAEGVPDWMRSAGWQESSGAAQAGSAEPGETLPDEPIVKADIPEWLKSMAPPEITEEANQEPAEPAGPMPVGGDGIPDWLKPMAPGEVAEGTHLEAQKPVEPPPAGEDDIPDWLKSMALEETAEEAHIEAQLPVEPPPAGGYVTPEGLQSSAQGGAAGDVVEPQQPVEPQPASGDGVPDWLKTMAPAKAEGGEHGEPQQPVEPQPASEDGVPDWLKSIAPAEAAGEIYIEPQEPVEPQQTPVESQPAGGDATPEWLKSSFQVGVPEEMPTEPQMPVEPQPASEDGLPDWLKTMAPVKAAGDEVGPQQPVEPQPASEDGFPDWLKSIGSAEAAGDIHVEPQEPVESQQAPVESQPAGEDATPEWLKSSAQVGVPEDVPIESQMPVEPQPASEGGVPDYQKSMESEPEPTPGGVPPANAGALPGWLTGMGAEAAAFTANEMEQSATGDQPVSELPVPPETVTQEPAKPTVPASGATSKSFQPTGEVKSLNIGDDAFGWLESLAAKQGAKPEELLTNPQERSEEMPDWLRQSAEPPVEAPIPPVQGPIGTPAETLSLGPLNGFSDTSVPKPAHTIDEAFLVKEETPSIEPPAKAAVQPVNDEDDTMAWLEQLTGDQETKPEEPLVSPAGDLGATPDWVQKVQDDQPTAPASEGLTPSMPENTAEESDITITSWLSKMDVKEALEKKSNELPGEAQPAAPVEDLPDWLKDLEKPAAPVEASKADNNLPEWLRPLPSSKEPEPVTPMPALASAPEPEAPSWVDENASVSEQASPTMPEEWIPAEPKAPAIPDSLPAAESTTGAETPSLAESVPVAETTEAVEIAPVAEPIPVAETPPVVEPVSAAEPVSFSVHAPVRLPTLKQTGMLSPIPPQDKDAELLSSAQTILDQNSLDASMKLYTRLIKKGRLLDEVIHDLREAIYRYPVDVIVWQTLGDAYMRANRLQDALDAYTKAEELLR
jgi:tetratricopeptide (TPR) repeat protein